MNVPKTITTYCPRCKKHTEHSVSLYKAGKQRSLSWGARRQERRQHGYGGQKYPELKRTAKTTKKMTAKLECKTCSHTVSRYRTRLRKMEIGG
ncbi:50S ribosomal protein L44e [Candidatus Bathyarchaeota archaeon]|jgi:large subunit ribosomal protein L44e|nr:50S ribosomal protein L44e [Candidatus Bathyarchaeota archaeon]